MKTLRDIDRALSAEQCRARERPGIHSYHRYRKNFELTSFPSKRVLARQLLQISEKQTQTGEANQTRKCQQSPALGQGAQVSLRISPREALFYIVRFNFRRSIRGGCLGVIGIDRRSRKAQEGEEFYKPINETCKEPRLPCSRLFVDRGFRLPFAFTFGGELAGLVLSGGLHFGGPAVQTTRFGPAV